MTMAKIARALLSVSDKTGIVEFAKALHEKGVELISTGGTKKKIAEAGIPVMDISEFTGFPEMLDGRVKTLHPLVHGGILAMRGNDAHTAQVAEHGIKYIDLVCVNLYPFEATIAKEGVTVEEAIENIDIGGPTMLRSAAKNYKDVTVVVDASDYDTVLKEMAETGGTTEETRFALMKKVFAHTARYDSIITNHFTGLEQDLPDVINFNYVKASSLRYGENPHQKAAFYRSAQADDESCIGGARVVDAPTDGASAKATISYNNYFDADGALELVKDIDKAFGRPAVAIIKHANPAGCAIDDDIVAAYEKAYFGDVNAAMGGIIAINRPMTEALASAIVETYQRYGKERGAGGFYAEVVIAPGYEGDAVNIIRARKGWGPNVRMLEVAPFSNTVANEPMMKYVTGGLLVQDRDLAGLNTDDWKTVTSKEPTAKELEDLKFAWLVCKHVKSNAIVLARDLRLLGAGAGQMSRVNSAFLAGRLAKHYGGAAGDFDTTGCALASDAFFPFADSLDWARDAGATSVIEPGGAKKDEDVIAYANELGLSMIFTSMRHFRH